MKDAAFQTLRRAVRQANAMERMSPMPPTPTVDPVNHPPHYTRGRIECLDAIEAMVEGWPAGKAYLLGNVLKYLWRHEDKAPLESLKKAAFYLQREIASMESGR